MSSNCEVREMRNAVTVLNIIRDHSRNRSLESYVIRKAVTRSSVGGARKRAKRYLAGRLPYESYAKDGRTASGSLSCVHRGRRIPHQQASSGWLHKAIHCSLTYTFPKVIRSPPIPG